MPLKSKSQQRFMFAAEDRGELPKGTAKRWAHHTKNIKDLPEKVGDKKAFVARLLNTCVSLGITEPVKIAEAAEALADALEKRANIDPLGAAASAAGTTGGALLGGGLLGLAAPAIAGYGMGWVGGHAKNQVDTDDAETLRISALANAYRRRAAEAKMNAQVQQLVASDPSKYVRIG